MNFMKLVKGNKAQMRAKIGIVVTIIISVVVLFQLFADLVPEAQSAGTQLSDETKCADVGCFVNSTLTPICQTNSSPQGFGENSSEACLVPLQNIPLASLFGSSGIVILLLMVFLFLTVLNIVRQKK